MLACCAATAAAAQPLQVEHAQGSLTLQGPPAKVIVLDMAALDTLDALGVPVAGAPTTPLPGRLKQYNGDGYLRAGTLFEPNYEVIHAAKPDLVIVGGRSAAKYAEVARIAPTIDLTADTADLLGSLRRNTETLGRLFGKQDLAQARLKALDESIETLRKKAQGAGTGLIVLTTGGKMSAYGPGSRFGVLHDAFGIAPADAKLNTSNHGQAISNEFILKTNPDWLFVIDRDAAIGREGASAQRLLDNELVRKTRAWQNGRVVYLDAMNWYLLGSAGLTAMQQNVEQLIRAFDDKS
ncbi:siderophore ABC transporter substrate-binding protein [Orrella sp. JC864]